MKVAFVLQPWETIDTPLRTGVAIPTVAYHLARGLARSGDRVAIYARRRAGQAAVETDEAGIEYRRLALPFEEPAWGACRRLEDLLDLGDRHRPLVTSPRFFRRFARRVARDLQRLGCDVVHLFTYPQLAAPFREADPASRIVLHMECELLIRYDLDRLRRQLRAVDLLIGCSDFITTGIRRRFPRLADRCCTVYNGVDPDAFAGAPRARRDPGGGHRLLYLGRISPEKGVQVLLDAFPRVLARHPDTRLDLVGPLGLFPERLLPAVGDERMAAELAPFYGRGFRARLARQWRAGRRLRGMLQERMPAEAAARVRFRGIVPTEEVARCYLGADLLVFPSICNEAFGLPIVEAMASGLAVVAARTGGIPEIVEDGRTGILVPPTDASGLAEAIAGLLGDPRRRLAMAAAGRRRARQTFAWDRVCGTLRDAYAHLSSTPRARETG